MGNKSEWMDPFFETKAAKHPTEIDLKNVSAEKNKKTKNNRPS